jgi:hypothetical protein
VHCALYFEAKLSCKVRAHRAARSRIYVLPSLRGALATKQSILALRRDGLLRLRSQ